MKMANGGYSPAANVQLATDTESRAILGVSVSNESSDSAGLSEPMREQVEQRTGGKVKQHLVDGGDSRMEDIVEAQQQGVELLASQTGQKPEQPGERVETQARRFGSDPSMEATHGKRRRQENLPPKGRHQRDGER